MKVPKIAVFASGGGSLLLAMIQAGVPIGLVLVDRMCNAVKIAEAAGIPVEFVDRREFGYYKGVSKHGWNRRGFTLAIEVKLMEHHIDIVAMAGFMTLLHAGIFVRFGGRILNIHPALLPLFPGEFAVRDTIEAHATETGSTIIIATEIEDDPRYIVAQQGGVPVLPDDTIDSLWERIKNDVERELFPRVLWQIIRGEIDLATIYASA